MGKTYAAVGTEHVHPWEVDLVASIAGACQACQRVVWIGTGRNVLRNSSGRRASRRLLSWVAGSTLDHVNGIVGLNLVGAEGIIILHDPARVDQPLSLNGDFLVVVAGKLGLELQNGGCLGHCDVVSAVRRRLHLEGDLAIATRLDIVGHGVSPVYEKRSRELPAVLRLCGERTRPPEDGGVRQADSQVRRIEYWRWENSQEVWKIPNSPVRCVEVEEMRTGRGNGGCCWVV